MASCERNTVETHLDSEPDNTKTTIEKTIIMRIGYRSLNACLCFALCLPLLNSCKDDYFYDDEAPGWLGNNIYEYLESRGNYTSYLALVQDLGYEETLRRTGSKTLFPANDEAYADYFRRKGMNGSGADFVRSLSESQKRYMFNSTMLNMAYLSNMLANVSSGADGLGEGTAVRRSSSVTYLDSVPWLSYDKMPKTRFWERFEKKGGTYLADNGDRMSVFFTPQYFSTINLSESDWSILARGWNMPWDASGLYVNGVHVSGSNKDVVCKNGYLHLADDVVTPLRNMAEVINETQEVSQFSKIMDMFAFPYYNTGVQSTLGNAYGGAMAEDSTVFVKRYFNLNDFISDPEGKLDIEGYGALAYDPSAHNWGGNTDMGVMFVPTDEAMREYWESPQGAFLSDKFPQWDSVYTKVLADFVQNHQQRSFADALPHNWNIMSDPAGFEMNVKESDIVKTIPANNGLIYITNKVYAPVDYQSVYAPVLISDSTKIMNPVIKNVVDDAYNLKYHFYLRSLDNRYNLLVPSDNAMKTYRDPISWAIWANDGIDNREIWTFRVEMGKVAADVFKANEDGTKGTFLRTLGDGSRDVVTDRLQDIMDMHIVVADNAAEPLSGYIDEGRQDYFLTKGGAVLAVSGAGENIRVKGCGDIELDNQAAQVITMEDDQKGRYEMTNGRAFLIDRIMEDSYRSVYKTMGDTEAFKPFFNLLMGDEHVFSFFEEDKDVEPIFDMDVTKTSSGIGPIVTSFNNYRYTILVPTGQALTDAFAADPDLHTWEEINLEPDYDKKKKMTIYLLNFLRYHFVDGILPVSDGVSYSGSYATAARDQADHFVYIKVNGNGSELRFASESNAQETAKVLTTTAGDYNVFARDFIVNNEDYRKANQIMASSRAVLHLVDRAINYRK